MEAFLMLSPSDLKDIGIKKPDQRELHKLIDEIKSGKVLEVIYI